MEADIPGPSGTVPAEHGQHESQDPAPPRGSRWWAVARLVVSLGLALLAFYILAGRSDELSEIRHYLDRTDYSWMILGFALEIVSQFSFAFVQRRLALSGGVAMSSMALFGITIAGNSITDSLPAGPAWASYFAFRQYRRLGADPTLSAWVLAGLFLASSVTLAVLATVGLVVASTTGSGSFGITNTIVSVVFGALVLCGLVAFILHRRGTLEIAGTRIVQFSQRVIHRPHGDAKEMAGSVARRLRTVSPDRSATAAVLGWAMGNWVTDLAALVVSFKAVGVSVPWSGILLAYGAGQLAANLPVTPGGLGVVEGSLTLALVAYGGSKISTVSAVLLYRLVSFWILLPLGWLAWLGIHFAERRVLRHRPVSLNSEPVVERVTR